MEKTIEMYRSDFLKAVEALVCLEGVKIHSAFDLENYLIENVRGKFMLYSWKLQKENASMSKGTSDEAKRGE
jgi:hypothetical protein